MSTSKWIRICQRGVGFSLLVILAGCRHTSPREAREAAEPEAFAGDPSTNIMVVPASATWGLRPGATNPLPSGIVSPEPFPFPEYDHALVKGVFEQWHRLLDAEVQPAATGQVVVEFELHSDGSISRLRTLPSAVTPRLEQLCQQAIFTVAPFPTWPPEMRGEIGVDYRSIRINFDFKDRPKGR